MNYIIKNKIKRTVYLCLFLISFVFLGCNDKSIKGFYFDINNRQIFEFKNKKLIVYNIKDSIKNNYTTSFKNDVINISSKNKKIKLNYSINNDTLILIDREKLFLLKKKVKLVSFEPQEKMKLKLYKDNYWHIKSDNTEIDYWIKFDLSSNKNKIFMYGKEEKSDFIFFDSSFDFSKELYFDKFWVYKFQSYVWDPYGYLLINSGKDSIAFRGVTNFDKINIKKYKSNLNLEIYSTWVNVNHNKNYITLFNNSGRFYFGDTIIFKKNNKFRRSILKQSNFFYQDTILKNRIEKLSHLKESEFTYEIGLNTKYLIFNAPVDQVLEVKKLTKDSLIIKNHTVGKNLLMKYTKVEN